jgi:hypothetical protein
MTTIKGYKNGKKIDIFVRNDKQYKKCKEHSPLEATRIIGIDTESMRATEDNESIVTLSVQCHTHNTSYVKDTRDMDTPIVACFDMLWIEYAIPDVKPHVNKQRSKRKREQPHDKRTHRDGRINTIPPTLWVFYNLEYDFGRLFRQNRQMIRTITADLDSVRIQVEAYEIEIVSQLVTGSCPSFEYFVRKDGYIMRVFGMDIGAYWKGGLGKTAEAILKGESKVAMDKELFKLTLAMFDALPQTERDHFWKYASEDARLTREIYLATVDLLVQVEPLVVKRNGIIPPSAPGAAAKIAFSWGPDVWELPPTYIHQAGMNAYTGARVFNRKTQYVENVSVWDIVSAYPHVMTLLPDPATCTYPLVKSKKFSLEEFKGQWGVVKIKGEGLDPYYPALRLHDEENARLRYIYGKFDNIWTTIPEMVIGVVSGRLRVDTIYTGFFIEGDNADSFLRKFVLEMFRIKAESEKDSPMYLLSKLLMNALYGKLVEVKMSNTRSIQGEAATLDVLKIPNLNDRKQEVYSAYAQKGGDGLVELYDEWYEQYPDTTDTIPFFMLFNSMEQVGKAGYYFLPMHGAQITGFVSAKLGLAAYCTIALQGDTDSIFTKQSEGFKEYKRLMDLAGYDCPMEGLGAFECEIPEASGYLVKNKMYALKYTKKCKDHKDHAEKDENCKECMKERVKLATHGITGLVLEDSVKPVDKSEEKELLMQKYYQLIEDVCLNSKSVYNARQVRKLRQAYTQEKVPGVFYQLEREISCKIDPNQRINEQGEKVWKRI